METAPAVVVCPPDLRREALIWLLEQSPGPVDLTFVEEWLAKAHEDPVVGRGLLIVWDGASPAAAVLATLIPGRLGSITPPRFAPSGAGLAPQLIAAAVDYSRSVGAQMAQAVLPPRHPAEDALIRAGFRTAQLRLLGCEVAALDLPPSGGAVRFDPADPADRLAEIVEATYEGTLDCAWMNGWRDVADVLATSRATGVYDPSLWTIASAAERPLGCLLLADHPQGDSLELVYMGVLPGFRGRGWGRSLIAQAQRVCRERGRSRLVLFVDAENWPARNAYRAAGFSEWDERVCFLRRL